MVKSRALASLLLLSLAAPAGAAPTRSSALAVTTRAPSGHTVFVVNPDSNSVGRLEFDATHVGTLTHEAAVGRYPRTLTLAGGYVFTADQNDDSVSRLDQLDLANRQQVDLGFGCAPYGVAATPGGDTIVVTCQGSSDVVLLGPDLSVQGRVELTWPNARAIAIDAAGARAYVTHFLTEEPDNNAHVSVIDLANKSIASVFAVAPDDTTCETQNSGQGPLNLISTIAIVPDGGPTGVAGEIWIGGTQQNNLSKGLFKREARFKDEAGSELFPWLKFRPFPDQGGNRNIYKTSFHDVTRFGIAKLAADGTPVGKIDIDEANNASDIEFSADGTTAYVVDLMFNSYHIFNTHRGQGGDPTTLFAAVSAFGPGGADPTEDCQPDALRHIAREDPYRLGPQAQITTIDGYEPIDTALNVVNTGVDFDAVAFWNDGTRKMRAIPDGIGTAPTAVRLSPDGETVYVANYLARNVVSAAAGVPLDQDNRPENFRCSTDTSRRCATNNDCSGGGGFCNHPGGGVCNNDADCGANGPCIVARQCIPLLLGAPVASITDGIDADPLDPSLLDGKILFNTAARDASVLNNVGLGTAAPLANQPRLACHNDPLRTCGTALGGSSFVCSFCTNNAAQQCDADADCGSGRCVIATRLCAQDRTRRCSQDADCASGPCVDNGRFCSTDPTVVCTGDGDCPGGTCDSAACDVGLSVPGELTSTSHDASYVTCTACHADYGGQDGRTWDFAQFGASLRNTMDLRGRSSFSPGSCSNDPSRECFFDAGCVDPGFCKMRDEMIPPNIPEADRARYFNPMLTVHWNGDRDEVEDFEHTYRQLLGAGDCDSVEDFVGTCQGALIQRNPFTSIDAADVDTDLGRPNRNITGPLTGKNVGYRLTHMADFVYSLSEFPRNPNSPTDATERGRKLFNDPDTQCASCHIGGPGVGKQFFSDKKPNTSGYDPQSPAGADHNNPFIRHDVGTGNLFDAMNPRDVASDNGTFQNPRIPIPGDRDALRDYVTPLLNDIWNTAPYLHDGSAHTLLDVVRPCDSTLEDCGQTGRGRNVDNRHGRTDMLTPQQLNDLAEFEASLNLATIVGTNERVLGYGSLTLKRAVVEFPKPRPGRGAKGAFQLAGVLRGAPAPVDPTAGVTLQVAFPDGGRMTVLARTFTMRKRGRAFVGRSTDGGLVTLRLTRTRNGFRFAAEGKKLDLSSLDTTNREFTVSVESSGVQFTQNRVLRGRRTVFKLPRR